MSRTCLGCGAVLQSEDEKKNGYIDKEKINDGKYCRRCFKIIHYNEKVETKLDNINEYIIDEINKNNAYVYFMIDILNINKETMDMYHRIKKNKSLIISKLDIIPKSIKKGKIIEWLSNTYNVLEPVLFQSSKKNLNTRSIINNLINNNIKKCYIVGYTNSGKSSLINKICDVEDIKHQELTTCLIPNTTVDFIKIKIKDNLTIYDSPGFTLNNPIYKENDFDLIERINPREELKAITYQVKDISYINLHDLILINSNINNSLTFYLSNKINLDRVFKIKDNFKDMERIEIKIPEDSDLVIKSVGFINVKKECILTIYSDNKNLFEVRKSIFNQ